MSEKPSLQALVLDDDPDFLNLAIFVLRQLGIRTEITSTPNDFLDKFKNSKPDCCFIDLNLGGLISGFALVQSIRSGFGKNLPVFVISSASDAQAIAHALEVGANDFIIKPLD